ncbi:MAG: S8 family serine peptidase [Candidatus Polarisedimenticolaceae bacterium]|nr:S8 family serine peptidase [Candidatus Polarisedimenticolaceae bacterium]
MRQISQLLSMWGMVLLLVTHTTVFAGTDDFDDLMLRTSSAKTVSVLVTGWQAITGDEPLPGAEQNPDAWMSITGDEFVKKLNKASNQVKVTRRYKKIPVIAMQMDAAALSAAKAQSSSVQIWDDIELHPQLVESTRLISADAAWRAGYTGKGLAVVVIDSGTDTAHPFFNNKAVLEACFADKCPNGAHEMIGKGAAKPVGAHGTHVAGIVLGNLGPGKLSGVGPELSLIAVNVFNKNVKRNGETNANNILAALDFILTVAEKNPASIGAVNMSLGAPRKETGICRHDAFDLASSLFKKAGIPVIVATGNDGTANASAPVGWPACIKGFVSVGAITKHNQVASFSNSGSTLDFLAPGVDILSSVPLMSKQQTAYQRFPGTSMAAPHVAGAIALLKQAAPGRTVDELVFALKKSGTPVRDIRTGIVTPVINIARAIALMNGGGKPPKADPPKTTPVKPAPPQQDKPNKRKDRWNVITG